MSHRIRSAPAARAVSTPRAHRVAATAGLLVAAALALPALAAAQETGAGLADPRPGGAPAGAGEAGVAPAGPTPEGAEVGPGTSGPTPEAAAGAPPGSSTAPVPEPPPEVPQAPSGYSSGRPGPPLPPSPLLPSPRQSIDQLEQPSAANRVPRILLEGLGAFGAGLLGGLGGLLVGAGIGCAGGHVGSDRCQLSAATGTLLGYGLGLPTGAWLTGNNRDGNGAWGWTALGSLGGWGLGALLVALIDMRAGPGAGLLMGFPVVGAVVGYELSSDTSARVTHQREELERLDRRVSASLAVEPIPGGAMVGVHGRL